MVGGIAGEAAARVSETLHTCSLVIRSGKAIGW